ncbi:MAG: glycoside hydrolase family 3 N-terminal domain-containing protein [Planctomycetota bacterium]
MTIDPRPPALPKLALLPFLAALLGAALSAASGCAARSRAASPRVERLLAEMTLEEKVGQMTQLTIDAVSQRPGALGGEHALDPAKLEEAVVRRGVGSILNVSASAFSLEHWHETIAAIQDLATKKTRLKIPVIYGIDAIHGANYTLGATIFPQPIALGATWDPDLAEEVGRITALEVRASGIPWNFYPVCDIGRQPLWPRLWETFGEDVYLARRMVSRYVRGLQGLEGDALRGGIGAERAAACLKHYAGYSLPLSGKDRTPAWIDERSMRQYVLPTFETGVRAGALTVMVNSGEVNGIPGHANEHLLTEILKGEWGFEGFVVSDWEDVKRLHTRDRVAATPKEAVRLAVMAGVDMSMVPYDTSFYDHLLELAKEGAVPMERIDDAVRRILRVKEALGLFDDPYPRKDLAARFASAESAEANLRVAREAITLLKNEKGFLPLRKGTRILVAGPAANLLSVLNGGWTITWQGDREDLYPKDKPTILRALEAANGEENVAYVPGCGFDRALGPEDGIAAALEAARDADAIVLSLGEKPYCETPGNIDDLTLDAPQLDLAEALAGTGKPVVLVLVEGRPRVIRRAADKIPAIVLAYLPGMEGGRAIADVLFGDVNPSGRLPFSYPRAPNAIVPYDHKPLEAADGNRYDPEFPFGHGLSYTAFEYGELEAVAESAGDSGTERVLVSVRVKNAGLRTGKEVVQLYVTDVYGSVSRPARELRGITKVELAPGESKVVRFELERDDFSFVGRENRWIFEPGLVRISVGGLARELELD